MRNQLKRKILGAILAALAVSILFTEFGYSDYVGPRVLIFTKEFGLALASYLPAALLVHIAMSRLNNQLVEVCGIGLLGSAFGWVMKLLFIEGQNGIPAYIAAAARQHSWRPYGDLVKDALAFIVFTTTLSLPFVAIGVWLARLGADKHMRTNAK